MILSKICKLGQCDDGITHWDQNLSSWILEHAEESEEFRPFFALSSESDAPPVKDQFNPAEEVVSSTRANKDQWKPMRPESLSKPEQATSDFEAANDVITEGEERITESDSQAPKEDENDVDHLEAADEQALEDEPVLTYEEGLQVGIQQGVEQGRRDAERLAEEKVSLLRQKN
jgi:flagellar biosynthesis/type III secretory pathway protein FliH